MTKLSVDSLLNTQKGIEDRDTLGHFALFHLTLKVSNIDKAQMSLIATHTQSHVVVIVCACGGGRVVRMVTAGIRGCEFVTVVDIVCVRAHTQR